MTITVTEYASISTSVPLDLSPVELGMPMPISLGPSQTGLGIFNSIPHSSDQPEKSTISRNNIGSTSFQPGIDFRPSTQLVTVIPIEKTTCGEHISLNTGLYDDSDMVVGPPEEIVTLEDKSRVGSTASIHFSNYLHSQSNSPITLSLPSTSDAVSRLHDPMPFTTTAYPEDKGTRPSFPTQEDKPMPVLEVSCLTRSRLLFSDFKITWGPAWDDQPGCQRLFHAMDRRGLITGWKCGQAADLELGYIMEAKGHRPMSPRSLVEGAIREAFAGNILYYREYESMMLCEKLKPWAEREMR